MPILEETRLGAQQAASKGETAQAKKRKTVLPARKFSAQEIKKIRKQTGLTQALFAQYMGVSVKTVEAWEAGRNRPEGAACRLLAITAAYPAFPLTSGIVKEE